MLETIKNGILTIVDFFTTVFDYVVGFIQDTIDFITRLPNAVEEVIDLVGDFLPPSVLAIFVSLLGVVVILRVLGRT